MLYAQLITSLRGWIPRHARKYYYDYFSVRGADSQFFSSYRHCILDVYFRETCLKICELSDPWMGHRKGAWLDDC